MHALGLITYNNNNMHTIIYEYYYWQICWKVVLILYLIDMYVQLLGLAVTLLIERSQYSNI